jgi:Flp pilus assembly protein TadD
VSDFDRAIELDPESWFAYGQRGLTLWALGRRDEAEADYANVRNLRT